MRGAAYLKIGREEEALDSFRAALAARTPPGMLMKIAGYLATHQEYEQALEYATRARKLILRGEIKGRARAEAPTLEDIAYFIDTVQEDKRVKDARKRGNSGKE
jgi:tetratricopeptide (TPR) repeat protein